METADNNSVVQEEHTKLCQSTVESFFLRKNKSMAILSLLLSSLLFTVWTLRTGIQFTTAIILILIQGLASIIVAMNDYREIVVSAEHEFHFRKTGVSWKLITDALVGLGLSFFFVWFVFASNESNSHVLANIVMLLAMMFTTLVMPVVPLGGMISSLSLLKTEVVARIDDNESDITLEIDMHPMDIDYKEYENNDKFRSAMKEKIRNIINNQ